MGGKLVLAVFLRQDLLSNYSSISRWRKRIGEEDCEKILAETLQAGLRSGAVKDSSLKRINVDTTVQPKAVRFPTDYRSCNRYPERLVRLARKYNIPFRQSNWRFDTNLTLMAR